MADEEIRDEEELEEDEEELTPGWAEPRWADTVAHPTGSVFVDTGRGQTTEVPVGSPFGSTIERLAEAAHYGGYFRVFLNGSEVLNPEEAPATIDAGMRITITSFDKVG